MRLTIHNYLALVIITLVLGSTTQAVAPTRINTSLITTQELQKNDEKWFNREFVRGFMCSYQDKTFFIKQDGVSKLLVPQNKQEKEKWLQDTAQAEFSEYVLLGKENYKALKIKYNGENIGAILYRLSQDEEHTIYLAQLFIHPDFQKKGISSYVIAKLLPVLHPASKKYEVLARHQNAAAFGLYNKLGFKMGDIALVQKYEYNPLFYMGLYKFFQK